MTESNLRDLFADTLHDEPAGVPIDVLVDADLARGHGRRRHHRIRRAASVGVVAAAVAIVVPPLVSPDNPNTGPAGADKADRTDVTDGDLTQAMRDAAKEALPDDVTFTASDTLTETGPMVSLHLDRDGVAFELNVAVQEARPDLRPLDPCADPELGELFSGRSCAGEDDEGRWLVVADADEPSGRNLIVLEGGSASVTTWWYPVPEPDNGDRGGAGLTDEEALAVTDAVWDVAAGRSPDQLTSGIDMNILMAVQGDLIAHIEDALGLGLSSDGVADALDRSDRGHDAFRFHQAWEAEGGATVVLDIWQKDRLYDDYCVGDSQTVGTMCTWLPESGETRSGGGSASSHEPAVRDEMVTVEVGLRGGVSVSITGADAEVVARLSDAVAEIRELIPMIEPT